MVRKFSCNPYEGGEIPPCSAFLNNTNPIIKDGKIIFTNENRLYCFISTYPPEESSPAGTGLVGSIFQKPATSTNLQVSLPTFIVGLFINQLQRNEIEYDEKNIIHSNKTANDFIHETLKKSPEIKMNHIPSLALVVSNTNAILPLFTYNANITPLNYFILFILNRLENDPGLFFGNNSYATADAINFFMSSWNMHFPFK